MNLLKVVKDLKKLYQKVKIILFIKLEQNWNIKFLEITSM